MFVFSQQHPWQGDEGVQQVLVFGSQAAKVEFDKLYAIRLEHHDVSEASDTGIGATYKLRSVKRSDGKFAGVIRDGCVGALIVAMPGVFDKPEDAIIAVKALLLATIYKSFS